MVEIGPIRIRELENLNKYLSTNILSFHGIRIKRQESGNFSWLIPWMDEKSGPVGWKHGEVVENGKKRSQSELRAYLVNTL